MLKVKHFLFSETLTDEACSLQKKDEYTHLLVPSGNNLRTCQRKLFTGEYTPRQAARALRQSRKTIMPHLKDVYGSKYVGIVADADGHTRYNKKATCAKCKD